MKNILRFFPPITSIPIKRKRESLKFRMGIPWFSEFYLLSASSPLLTFKNIFMEFVVNYKVIDIWVFFPLQQESGQSKIFVRSYDKNTEIVQDVSISGFFQFWLKWISFFPFLFSYTFDFFNISKTMLQFILTLVFFWLYVSMLNGFNLL